MKTFQITAQITKRFTIKAETAAFAENLIIERLNKPSILEFEIQSVIDSKDILKKSDLEKLRKMIKYPV